MASRKLKSLTTPDLVLLSLLAERPMHGYDANLQLESRNVREWAGVSKPQVYYSLEKLARLDMIRPVEGRDPALGPDRRVFSTTARGRAALADSLERDDWTSQQDRPAFLTWLALSWQARPGVFLKQVHLRRKFLATELARRKTTLHEIRKEVGHSFHEAVWMVSLTIQQISCELRWLSRLVRESPRRAPARNPQYIGGTK